MVVKIKKWGNSLAVRLSKQLAESMSITEGSQVQIIAKGDAIIVKPVKDAAESFQVLVDQITPENRHDAVDWGEPVGKEIW